MKNLQQRHILTPLLIGIVAFVAMSAVDNFLSRWIPGGASVTRGFPLVYYEETFGPDLDLDGQYDGEVLTNKPELTLVNFLIFYVATLATYATYKLIRR